MGGRQKAVLVVEDRESGKVSGLLYRKHFQIYERLWACPAIQDWKAMTC